MGWQYWTESAGKGTWREVLEPHADVAAGELRVRSVATAVSRGTETLVHTGKIPETIAHLMRAPQQLGDFPFPVSYGYLGVGVVDEGPADWLGARVFGLLPHHTHHVVTTEDVQRIPDHVPDHRALLAGAAETGLNILWQEPPRIADRVAVIGAGMIGTATALLASGMALDRLEVLETNPDRRRLLETLGLTAVDPSEASSDNDIVIHTSGTEPGLARAWRSPATTARWSRPRGSVPALPRSRWAPISTPVDCPSWPARWVRSLRDGERAALAPSGSRPRSVPCAMIVSTRYSLANLPAKTCPG
ncbi:hypothetical protein [Kocuria atrinae]|uniref:hypothetical protein n=1 Tax=Kocuria atrinae TaxID=592377 RepID=UPI001CB89123|nr:hypothetical protein [Kocuria atrinae]